MIIDIHNHIGLSQDGGHGELEELVGHMQRYGISHACLFATDEPHRSPTYENLNGKILDAQTSFPGKILAFARIVPSAGQAAVEEFSRCLQRGVRGLKLKPVDGFEVKQAGIVLDLVRDRGDFPVLIHTAHDPGSEPELWEDVFRAYPKLNFILAHGGKDLYKVCADLVMKHDNVFVDTTTLSYNRTRHIYQRTGAEKILFGSDYPYSHPAVELTKFRVLMEKFGSDEDLKKILCLNARRLLALA